MNVVLRQGEEALEACAPEWRALEETGDGSRLGPFQRLAWARAWMKSFGRGTEPWILVATDPGAAILPLVLVRRRGVRTLRFLGHGVSDYLGCVPLDAPIETYRAFGAALAKQSSRFDLLELQSLCADDARRRAFVEGLGRASAERLYERCPVIDATGDWDAFLASRKKKFRANLKRAERRVTERGTPIAACETITPDLFDELVRVERGSWKWAVGTAFLQDERARRFLSSVLLSDPVPHEIWTLRVAGELAGFAVVLLASGARLYYLPSFREDVPDSGTWLLGAIVRDSMQGGFREFDFLRGDEGYKLAWAHRERAVHQLVAAGSTPFAALALAAIRLRWRLARSERVRRLREALLRLSRRASPGT